VFHPKLCLKVVKVTSCHSFGFPPEKWNNLSPLEAFLLDWVNLFALLATLFCSSASVRIVISNGNITILGKLEGLRWIAAIASLAPIFVTAGAVYELLLCDLNSFTRLDCIGTFEDTCCGKCPAGSTQSLVLD
jgi:hypothetical protein